MSKSFDLLHMVQYGGCSAKLPAGDLQRVLSEIPRHVHPNLLVGEETHDDAGVYKISAEQALILTTDFFPPLCSDPYEFGQIAAANALSDVFAMGGEVLTALNLVMFPAGAPMEVLREILRGGQDKVAEAGGVVCGGHTIVDEIPKYGLAVTGWVHPDKVITNAASEPGDLLILTKPIGAGMVLAGHRIGEVEVDALQEALDDMKILNRKGADLMQQYDVRAATDITGFGLAGHAMKLAMASACTLEIDMASVPLLRGAHSMAELGCIPGACFRNQEYTSDQIRFSEDISYEMKMLMMDAQTSGGLLICCRPEQAGKLCDDLIEAGYVSSAVIGQVSGKKDHWLEIT